MRKKTVLGVLVSLVLSLAPSAPAANMGIDEIYDNGTTLVRGDTVNDDVQYTAVAYNTRHAYADSFMGARADGGIQETYYNSGWVNGSVVFTDLCYNAAHSNKDFYYGVRADGGVQEIYYSGDWLLGDRVNAGVMYNAVAHSTAMSTDSFVAAPASGGVQVVSYSGGWNSSDAVLTDKVYGDLAYNPNSANDMFYGVVIPEPMTLSLLAVGGLLAVRRRRR
ncbi:MAG: PEP-CTERM sorting domain-containing protein [Phycisphaerae bacterium]|nr:PEP-CTERM sorting domain-containing protein [Phycisphaerae bacterium]